MWGVWCSGPSGAEVARRASVVLFLGWYPADEAVELRAEFCARVLAVALSFARRAAA
jgi:hypothetical protein